uniref:Pancreatic trypsin inhibitor n=1 Tax=Rhipicephalus appendiculatus TaxID=34631 RepID=A0A131YMX9_RHIAP
MKRTSFVALQLAYVIHVHGFLEIKTQMHACMQPKDAGPCRASVPRWYFNAYEQVCKEFIYGGCQGNNNRFETKAACDAACSHMKTKEHPCMQPPKTGPCRAHMLSWFFDKRDRVCKVFVYGGCRGNSNRFATEMECQASCLSQSSQRAICSLDPKLERCYARAQLWYFDPNEDTCHRCPRGFCGGSANKFPTCEKCMKRCSRADAIKTCSLAYRKIHYGTQGITWPGKTEPRVRGPGVIAPGHLAVPMPSITAPGGTAATQGGTVAPTLTISAPTPTEPGDGVTGLTGPMVPTIGLGGSVSNNNGQGRPWTAGPSSPGYNVIGPGSSGSGHHENVKVVPLPPRSTFPSTTAPGLAGSFSGAPNLTSLTEPLPAGAVRAGQPETGVAGAVPAPTATRGPGPRVRTPLTTVPTGMGSGEPYHGIGPSHSAPITNLPSTVASGYGRPGSHLTGTIVSATAQAGSSARETLQRGSDLKSPPFTLPAHFLLKV